ncbi:MAG: DUF3887 domain-containing protein [Candidatus Cloacimonetes bacterium]|nr:DUF3887 domain-containing protein [Candidatus Cloacimonadota bacterium]
MEQKKVLLSTGAVLLVVGALVYWALTRMPETEEAPLPMPTEVPEAETQDTIETETADAVVEALLKSISSKDYEIFSENVTSEVTDQLNSENFGLMSDSIIGTCGHYLSKGEATASYPQVGFTNFSYPCQFEKEEVILTVSFRTGENKVAGLNFDSEGLRKLQQQEE